VLVLAQDLDDARGHVLHAVGVGQRLAQPAEQAEPAAAQDLRRGLGGDVHDALDVAVLVADRRVART
jgi:hypothetical protein